MDDMMVIAYHQQVVVELRMIYKMITGDLLELNMRNIMILINTECSIV